MKNDQVRKLHATLGLNRDIVGIHFLYTWAEYQDSEYPDYGNRTRFCAMVKQASENKSAFKCSCEAFSCGRSRIALGVDPVDSATASGEVYYGCGLYSSRAIAKQVQNEVICINQQIYGIEIGPLSSLKEADVVIFMTDSYHMMRVVQAYCNQFGALKQLGMAGNQGVCSDLCARPYEKNDLNFSFLCEGTRRACGWSRNDIGVGLPINLFDGIVDGVLKTLSLIETQEEKEQIAQRLISSGIQDVSIDKTDYYGIHAGAWRRKRTDDEKRLATWLQEYDTQLQLE